ncbi:MAG: 4Fe-4S dicluster domain-containing protein [Clostridiales bacterium]|nr:4Fe-4S dicluster domain-containing protein [Clostridiales bacterium]
MATRGPLGFGLMRLPRKGISIDIKQTSAMVDRFLEAGFTYFDTAHIYPGSEDAARKALVERHPRESYTLATKLFAPIAVTTDRAHKQLATSLKRTGAEYFDYYLLHSIMDGNIRSYDRMKLWDYVLEQKQKGFIRHVGFSFHGSPKLLEKLLGEHPEVEFVQLQINYADWENPSVQSRACYEIVRRFGKQITVMEPVKGGALADPPAEVKKLFNAYDAKVSAASWALRFVTSLDGILTVLSGMSNTAQMEDNIRTMRDFRPLDEQERAIILKAQRILGHSRTIPCTACGYCAKGCPKQIPIPQVFAAMNLILGAGQEQQAKERYADIVGRGVGVENCVGCGQCERACPQHIEIIKRLRECGERLESAE